MEPELTEKMIDSWDDIDKYEVKLEHLAKQQS
jgi:hypothetical protein